MVAVVNSGGKGGILNPGGDVGWRGRWGWWKEAHKLKSLGMRASTGNAVVLCDGLVESGRNI